MNDRGQLLLVSGLLISFTVLVISSSIAHSVVLGRHLGERHDLTPALSMVEQHFPPVLNAELAGLQNHTGDRPTTLAAAFDRAAEDFEGRFASNGLALSFDLLLTRSLGDDRYNLSYNVTLSDGHQTVVREQWLVVSMEAGDAWWNPAYHYRLRLKVTLPYPDQRVSLTLPLDFTPLLATLGAEQLGSVRVVAQRGESFTPLPTGLLPAPGFDARTAAAGTLAWTTTGVADQRYYAYFDPTAIATTGADLTWNGSVVQNEQLWWEPQNNSLFMHWSAGALEMATGGYHLAGANVTGFATLTATATDGAVWLSLGDPALNRSVTLFSGSGLVALADDRDAWTGLALINFTTLKTGTSGLPYAMLNRTGTWLAWYGENLSYQFVSDGASEMLLVRGADYLYLTAEGHDDVRKMGLNLAGLSVTTGASHRLA